MFFDVLKGILLAIRTIICTVLLVIGIIMFSEPFRMERLCNTEVQAEVIRLATHEMTDRDHNDMHQETLTLYAAVYSYEFEGKKYTAESRSMNETPSHSVGDVVTIKIDPKNPKNHFDGYHPSNDIGGLFFAIIGLIGILDLIYRIVKKKLKATPKEDEIKEYDCI